MNDLRRNFRSAANAKFHRRSQESELRSQELQELQNLRARSSSENPGQASPRENLRRNPDSLAPELLQLLTSEFWNVSQEHRQVSEKLQELQNLRARSSSENPGQASARENLRRNPDSLAPELLQLLTSEFWNVVRNTVKFQRSCRSCRICEQGLHPKIRDRHLPGKISAGIQIL